MSDEQDQGEKTEEPSQTRIDEFRNRGEVASSKELNSVLVLSAGLMTLVLATAFMYETFSEFIQWMYTLDHKVAFTEKSFKTITMKIVVTAFKTAGPVLVAVLVVGVGATLAQIGFLFSPEVLTFKPERIDPIAGTKRLFTMKSVVEAIKGLFKFIFIMAIVYNFMKDDIDSWAGFLHMHFFDAFMHGKAIIAKIGFLIILALACIAAFDFLYQRISYMNKLRQTKDAAKREHKEQDGNPEVKQKIKAIQREMAQKRMLNDIKSADVVITNPTHISIVIKYDDSEMVSPRVVGRGADHMAFQIRKIAKEHNIPIVENVPLARTLYKAVKVGDFVPRNLYKAVAEVLAFIYRLKKKNKALL